MVVIDRGRGCLLFIMFEDLELRSRSSGMVGNVLE